VKVIDFTGGEPLLHRELSSLLKEAKGLGFVTTITTNCLLYPKRARELKDLIDMLHFSLDSGMKNVHDEMRGVACFDKVMESIEIARSLQERPDILFTAFDHNLDQIEKIYHEIVLPNDLVLILNPSFSYNNVKASLNEKSLKILSTWSNKKNIYLNKAFIELRRNGGNHIENPVCKAASSTIVISPENKLILPCYHLGIQEFPINGDLFSLYHSSEVQHLAALEGKLPECEGCTINCYMQPSFAVEMNKYWWMALPSTIKYNAIKGTWKSALKAF
jgi:MoaA/NifB/PqqE/SkfB family radical SAM enzyme